MKTAPDRMRADHTSAPPSGKDVRPEQKAAESLAKKLADKGYESYVSAAEVQGKARHRVRVGRLNNRAEAEALRQALKDREKLSQTMIAKQ